MAQGRKFVFSPRFTCLCVAASAKRGRGIPVYTISSTVFLNVDNIPSFTLPFILDTQRARRELSSTDFQSNHPFFCDDSYPVLSREWTLPKLARLSWAKEYLPRNVVVP